MRRTRAGKAFGDKDRIFRALFKGSGDASLLLAGGVFVDCNAAALRMMGCAKKNYLMGKRPEELSPERQPDGSLSSEKAARMAAIALKDGTNRFEWTHRKSDGSDLFVEIMLTSIPVNKQRILYTTWRDITDRQRAELALREKEERYRSLVKQSSDAIYIADPGTGKIQEANDRALTMFGYSEDEIVQLSLYDLIAERKQSIGENIEKLLRDGECAIGPRKYRHRDGSTLTVEVSASLIRYGEQDVIMSNVRDITERSRTEAALAASEERYRMLVESSSDAIIMLDGNRRIVSCNQGFLRLFGYEREETENRSARFLHPTDESYRDFGEAAYPIMEKEDTFRVEWVFVRKDGKEFPAESVTSNIHGPNGSVTGYVAVIRDISERKRTEEQIKYLSFHDKLTGLYNRAYFEEELKRLDTVRQLPLSLVMGDANGLKIFNDVFGHKEGDKLLRSVGEILTSSCRKEDMVARWGGDEFVILLPKTDEKSATYVTQRIRESCATADLNILRPSIALGVATKDQPDQNIQKVLKEAEDRMYRNKLMETTSARSSIILSLQKTLQERSHETEEHAKRLQKGAVGIGRALHLDDAKMDELVLLAALHDIGKIGIPDEILNKPGPLSEKEWAVMQKHCEIGYRIAQATPDLTQIGDAILAHHERWDGRGYPLHLREEEIPLISRILAIVDAVDVMVQGRPYRRGISRQEALAEVERCSGAQFDPALARLFLSTERELGQVSVKDKISFLGELP